MRLLSIAVLALAMATSEAITKRDMSLSQDATIFTKDSRGQLLTDTALVFVRARTKGGSDLTTIISNMARNNLYTGLPERHQVFDTTDSAQKKVKNYYAGMGFELNDSTFVEKTSDKKTDPIFHVADDRHKVAVFAPKSKANREVGALASDAYTRYLDLRGANVSSKEAQKRVDIFFTKSDDFIERQVDRVTSHFRKAKDKSGRSTDVYFNAANEVEEMMDRDMEVGYSILNGGDAAKYMDHEAIDEALGELRSWGLSPAVSKAADFAKVTKACLIVDVANNEEFFVYSVPVGKDHMFQFFKLAQIPYMFGTSSALPAAEGGQVYLAIGINAPDSIMAFTEEQYDACFHTSNTVMCYPPTPIVRIEPVANPGSVREPSQCLWGLKRARAEMIINNCIINYDQSNWFGAKHLYGEQYLVRSESAHPDEIRLLCPKDPKYSITKKIDRTPVEVTLKNGCELMTDNIRILGHLGDSGDSTWEGEVSTRYSISQTLPLVQKWLETETELRKINKKNKTTGFLQDLVTSIVKGTKSKQDEILSKDIESNSDWLEIQAAAAAVLTALGVLAAALRSGYNRYRTRTQIKEEAYYMDAVAHAGDDGRESVATAETSDGGTGDPLAGHFVGASLSSIYN